MVSSETADQQQRRRERSGAASHESFAECLHAIAPDCRIEDTCCVDGSDEAMNAAALERFDGVLFAGSPIQMHEDTEETRRAARFMGRVFESGTPSFGACAGLQIAAVAAGGTSRPREGGIEAGFSRAIVSTGEGRDHPMLRGRPIAWDALAMHSSVVDRQPSGMTVLARAKDVPVEAAVVRSGAGEHWGVQYHPELRLGEIADALRAQGDTLVEEGKAADEEAVERYANDLRALDADPGRGDIAWRIGIDEEITAAERRTLEIRNFLRFAAERR